MSSLSITEYKERINKHHAKLDPFIFEFRKWRNDGIKHPVYDFLFSYYSFSSGQLRRWSPGINVLLEECKLNDLDWPEYFIRSESQYTLNTLLFPSRRIPYLNWAISYLEKTLEKNPIFHCFGLHEWAMVYKSDIRQHPQIPLRHSMHNIQNIVEINNLCCTHYDAFRFFTKDAVPLNRYQLKRESVMEYDQPGCIHANMDLYKFGYKISPFVSSELLCDLFLLAKEAREIDMRASPYDLKDFKITPIYIETKEGQEEYIIEQKKLYTKGRALRIKLLTEYKDLLNKIT